MYCLTVVFIQLILAFRNTSTFFSLITMRCLIISPPNTSSQTVACMPIMFSGLQPSFPGFFCGYQLDLCHLSFTTEDSLHSPGCARAVQGVQLGQGRSCVCQLRSGPSLSSQDADTESFPCFFLLLLQTTLILHLVK